MGQRLKRLREARGISQAQLAKACGYKSQGAIGNIEADTRKYGANVVAIARTLGTTPEYLLMETSAERRGPTARAAEDSPTYTSHAIRIPLLENSGSMGHGADALSSDTVAGALSVSRHWLHERVRFSARGALRLIHAYGDSMEPTMRDSDILLVDTGQRDPGVIDGVYVLRADGRLYIKRVRKRYNSNELEVSSDNPTVKTVDVLDGSHALDVIGRVVWVWNGVRL